MWRAEGNQESEILIEILRACDPVAIRVEFHAGIAICLSTRPWRCFARLGGRALILIDAGRFDTLIGHTHGFDLEPRESTHIIGGGMVMSGDRDPPLIKPKYTRMD